MAQKGMLSQIPLKNGSENKGRFVIFGRDDFIPWALEVLYGGFWAKKVFVFPSGSSCLGLPAADWLQLRSEVSPDERDDDDDDDDDDYSDSEVTPVVIPVMDRHIEMTSEN